MKKRVVSLLMICALSVGMLAGCGSSETQNQATGSADNTQTAGTETVAETKTPEAADDANLTATQQLIKLSADHRSELQHGVRVAAAQEQQDLRAADRRFPETRRNFRNDSDPGW